MTEHTRNQRPNVLILLSDDQGPWALGCETPELQTPVLDGLAADGLRFTNFFCASPVCSPARASLLTGRIPSAHGIHDWLRKGNVAVDERIGIWSGKDRPIEYLKGLSGFTDVLAANGYRCGLSGKWHMGDSARPQKGHSFWCAHTLGGGDYRSYNVYDNGPEMEYKTEYVTDFFTRRAIDFLQAYGHAPEPFCLSVTYTAPHTPWGREHHPAELFALYEDCAFDSVPSEPAHPWAVWKMTPEERIEGLKGYFAAITGMDRGIGRILETLDALGLRENTLVVFLSDNGFNLGHHGIIGKGNGTYPMNMTEESVKVPFIVSWPGHVPHGLHEGLWSQYDFRPTLLDYLGMPDPEAETLPGHSFAGVLRGEPAAGREDLVIFDEYGPTRMIREQAWKYVHRYPDGPHELYHLEADPGEKSNLVDDPGHAPTLARLRGKLEEWFRRYADPAKDGAVLPVSGVGQLGAVDVGRDAEAFAQRE